MRCAVGMETMHSSGAGILLSCNQLYIGALILSLNDGYGYQRLRKPHKLNMAKTLKDDASNCRIMAKSAAFQVS